VRRALIPTSYATSLLFSLKKNLYSPKKIGEERRKVVEVETDKLLKANIIREVDYTTWLANVVMV